jgi:hypothetical protein
MQEASTTTAMTISGPVLLMAFISGLAKIRSGICAVNQFVIGGVELNHGRLVHPFLQGLVKRG